MDVLIEKYRRKVSLIKTDFIRELIYDLDNDARLIGIKGARGVGKTTLLLQYIKLNFNYELNKVIYVSLDDIWFSENKLNQLVSVFVKSGGKYIFIDEVHKYKNWAIEIKNIYDDYPELKIYFTGSSLLEIINARADLSRRAIIYNMQGLSFREYLNMTLKKNLKKYTLLEILNEHEEKTREIVAEINPFEFFQDYLRFGYYPFFQEQKNLYYERLEAVINMILEIELPLLRNVNIAYINKLKQLLYVIAESVPFVPNISKLAERIGINRETLLAYLFYLNESNLLFSAYKDSKGITILQKPDKLYLENSNLMYALNSTNATIGNVRETFFVNQLKNKHIVEISKQTDFIIDNKYFVEIGGKTKNKTQINGLNNAYIVADNIEYGVANKIPLWLFGFLY